MNSIKTYNKKELYRDLVFLFAFIGAAFFIFCKCRYGVGNVDESFYLTVPYRLFKGDALFLEEWHLSQMAGVLTLPFVSLYVTLTGGTAGIILAMRYVCTFIQCIITLFLYIRLKRINYIGALLTSISFALYIPFGIMALSYNSMGIMCQVVAFVILLTAQKHKELQFVIAGLFFAAAVLCCPYLAAVYFVYALAVCIKMIIRKVKKQEFCRECGMWTFKGALFITAGAAIAAVLFAVFVLSRAPIEGIIKAFEQIMNDPEHPPLSLSSKTKYFFSSIVKANSVSPYIYLLLTAITVAIALDKGRSKRRVIYFVACSTCVFALMGIYWSKDYLNHTMWAINMFAPAAAILSEKKISKQIIYTVWIPGMLYAYCLHLTSNQVFYAISSASAVSTVGSIVIVSILLCEITADELCDSLKYIAVAAFATLMTVQLYSEGVIRHKNVFWETSIKTQTVYVADGLHKGIYVTESKLKDYNNAVQNLKVIEEYDAEKVLFLSKNTWYYLITDYEMSTYSAWLAGVNEHTVSRLKAYYEINPEKLPDAVYADEKYAETAVKFCEVMGYTATEVGGGYILIPEVK